MIAPSPESLLLALSFAAGAIHVAAPDHWMPTSIVAWQRHWGRRRTVAFTLFALLIHLALGVGLYFALRPLLRDLSSRGLVIFTIALVGTVALVRGLRAKRFYEVFRSGARGRWAFYAVVSLLGPCESLLPVLVKAGQLGVGYVLPSAVFLAGTVITGTLLVSRGGRLWDEPVRLIRSLQAVNTQRAALPMTAALVAVLALALR